MRRGSVEVDEYEVVQSRSFADRAEAQAWEATLEARSAAGRPTRSAGLLSRACRAKRGKCQAQASGR